MRWLAVMLVTLLVVSTAGADMTDGRIVDLSHAYDAQTIYWPTETGFVLEKEHDGATEKGYYYRSNRFSTPEHGGTHIDAPSHFWKEGRGVDAIPLEQLVGRGVVVDVSRKCATDHDYRVSVDDFREWEKAHGAVPRHSIVLLRTGFAAFWPDRSRYLGTDERGADAVVNLHFPGLHPEAAAWLVKEREIKAVGLDTASIDYGQSTLFESHVTLFRAGVPAFENLTNLEALPPKDFTVVALPMKIRDGSGAPLRAIAVVEKK